MSDTRSINPAFGGVPFGRRAGPAPALAGLAGLRPASFAPTSLKILHILRAPLGGLFRHVVDVAQSQIERGHRVGLIVDSMTGGTRADALLAALRPRPALRI